MLQRFIAQKQSVFLRKDFRPLALLGSLIVLLCAAATMEPMELRGAHSDSQNGSR